MLNLLAEDWQKMIHATTDNSHGLQIYYPDISRFIACYHCIKKPFDNITGYFKFFNTAITSLVWV